TATGATGNETASSGISQQNQSNEAAPETVATPASLGSPSTRKFRQGSEVYYVFVIYNAQVDAVNSQPQLESQIILFRDGKAVYTNNSTPIKVNAQTSFMQNLTGNQTVLIRDRKPVYSGNVPSVDAQTNGKPIIAGSKLRLGANMGPGEYIMQ